MSSQFVHLHLHTQYSLLDGANQLNPLLKQVRDFPTARARHHGPRQPLRRHRFLRKGHRPRGEAHHRVRSLSRARQPASNAKACWPTTITIILILLATSLKGYHNLIKLSSKAYLEGFYYKPRMDKELLQEHHEGLIALSGCLSGEVPYLIGQRDMEKAAQTAGEYREIFGKDHYYLEVQANGLDHQLIANRGLVEIHKKLGIPSGGDQRLPLFEKRRRAPA